MTEPLPPAAAPVLPLLNYASPVLRKRLSRLAVASFCFALAGLPVTVAAAFLAGIGRDQWAPFAALAAWAGCHLACLVLGLWANRLIKSIQGRRWEVFMAAVGVGVGSVALALPILFLLGLMALHVLRV